MVVRRRYLLLIHLGFFLTGIIATMLGPLLPILAARWSLDDARAGRLFTTLFLGSLVAVTLSGRLVRRFGYSLILAGGFTAMLAGVLGLGTSLWTCGLASVFSCGFGCGLVLPASNLLVSEANPERRAAALNILNFAWCFGAIAGPAAIGVLLPHGGLRLLLPSFAVLLAVMAGALAGERHPARGTQETTVMRPPVASSWRAPMVVLTAALLFLYTGTETGLSGWIPSYIDRLRIGPRALGALGQSVFWAGILVGRVATPVALRRSSACTLMFYGLGLNLLGSAALLAASSPAAIFTSILAAGLGFSLVFPTAVAIFSEYYGASAVQRAPYIFAAGGLGGAVIPWLVGCLSMVLGSLRVALLFPLLCTATMIAIQRGIGYRLQAAGCRALATGYRPEA